MTELCVEQSKEKYILTVYTERTKLSCLNTKGFTLTKDSTPISKLGPYPARSHCYSLTNSYLSRLVKEKLHAE